MSKNIKELRSVKADNCVTIVLNTHRTRPENEQDHILLKNLIKEAEERLLAHDSKRDVQPIIDRMHALASSIDHQHNLESLILFVNHDHSDYFRLPIAVTNRVVIDDSFATKDLLRAIHQEAHYYILVLSQHKVRLLEAMNDKLVAEIKHDFPMENRLIFGSHGLDASNAAKQKNIIAEFFNQVDKALNEHRKSNPLPVLVCTEEANYHEYLKIADQKHSIYDFYLNKNRMDEKDQTIVSDAWPLVQEHLAKVNLEKKSDLLKAVASGKYLSDINDIYRAIKEGRIDTLFLEEGLYQAAEITEDHITLVNVDEATEKHIVDDVYDELIELNMAYGGKIVFLPAGELADFQGFGAITRY